MLNLSAQEIIAYVIEEEGGWQLTDHADDPDVATYGGMRWATYDNWQKMKLTVGLHYNLNTFKIKAANGDVALQSRIADAYKFMFYDKARIDELPEILRMPMYSCAVNIGTLNAVKILQRTHNILLQYLFKFDDDPMLLVVDGVIGTKTVTECGYLVDVEDLNTFIDEWIRHYINLVQANAEAWRDYRLLADRHEEPAILRATFLEGWFNRATMYRYL